MSGEQTSGEQMSGEQMSVPNVWATNVWGTNVIWGTNVSGERERLSRGINRQGTNVREQMSGERM